MNKYLQGDGKTLDENNAKKVFGWNKNFVLSGIIISINP